MFLTYTFCRRGEILPRVIKTSKYVYHFCYPGGLGEISPRSGKLANRDSEFEFQSVYA